jgi:hypothetical protein
MVVESLSDQKDIAALVRVKWTLYHRLHTFLCRFNVQHYEGAGLLSVARNGQSSLVQKKLWSRCRHRIFWVTVRRYYSLLRGMSQPASPSGSKWPYGDLGDFTFWDPTKPYVCTIAAAHCARLGHWRWQPSYCWVYDCTQSPVRLFGRQAQFYTLGHSGQDGLRSYFPMSSTSGGEATKHILLGRPSYYGQPRKAWYSVTTRKAWASAEICWSFVTSLRETMLPPFRHWFNSV